MNKTLTDHEALQKALGQIEEARRKLFSPMAYSTVRPLDDDAGNFLGYAWCIAEGGRACGGVVLVHAEGLEPS